jgi:hypothetical protein
MARAFELPAEHQAVVRRRQVRVAVQHDVHSVVQDFPRKFPGQRLDFARFRAAVFAYADDPGSQIDVYGSFARQISGSGIGLFVCARLIEAMGGRVWAQSRPEGGAEFGFALRTVDETLDD